MLFKLTDNSEFDFQPKKVDWRMYFDLRECLEKIRDSKDINTTKEQTTKGLSICVENPELKLNVMQVMQILAETIQFNSISETDRKKSE